VQIGWRTGRRVVSVRDDGVGFEVEPAGAGQGLKSMRRRAAAIDGGFTLRSSADEGTAIEIVLRAA
jgi:signal transduction histidine kinase